MYIGAVGAVQVGEVEAAAGVVAEGSAALRLALSGGGLLDHNYEVHELQAARRAFHVLWIVAALRDGLRAAGEAHVLELLALLPQQIVRPQQAPCDADVSERP